MASFFSDEEKACIRKLAELLTAKRSEWIFAGDWAEIGLTEESAYRVLLNLEACNVIWIAPGSPRDYKRFQIAINAIRENRYIEEEQRSGGDIVAAITAKMRRNSIIAYLIIVYVVIAATVALVASCVTIFKDFGWIAINQAK